MLVREMYHYCWPGIFERLLFVKTTMVSYSPSELSRYPTKRTLGAPAELLSSPSRPICVESFASMVLSISAFCAEGAYALP